MRIQRIASFVLALALLVSAAFADQYGVVSVGPGKGLRTIQPGAAGTVAMSNGPSADFSFQSLSLVGGGTVVGGTAHQVGGVRNLVVAYATTNTVTITCDQADLTNGTTMTSVSSISVVLDITAASPPVANGGDASLDTSSAWRYIWLISGESGGIWTTASLLSASATSPTLPTGYTHKRLVSYWRQDGSSNLIPFRHAAGFYGWMSVVAGGTTAIISNAASSTSYASVSCASFVPPGVTSVLFQGQQRTVTNNINVGIYLQPTGYTSGSVQMLGSTLNWSGTPANYTVSGSIWCPVNSSQSVDWRAVSATTEANYVNIAGFATGL